MGDVMHIRSRGRGGDVDVRFIDEHLSRSGREARLRGSMYPRVDQ
jgi:hypothetical protein